MSGTRDGGRRNRVWGERRSKAELEAVKALLATNPETGERDYLNLQARCVHIFGSSAGILCRELVHLTGLSALEDGWLWNNRQAWRERTGLGNRELEKARAILRGDKAWAGRKVKVLEERRPSRRSPTEYRLDLLALAAALGVEVPAASEGFYPNLDDFDDIFEDDLLNDAPESPRGAARDGAGEASGKSESPREATESPHGAGQPPYGAAESPSGAASEGTYRGSAEVHTEDPPAGGAEPASAEPAPSQTVGLDQESDDPDFGAPAGFAGLTPQQEVSEGTTTGDLLAAYAGPAEPEPPRLDGRRKHELWALMSGDRRENRVYGLTTLHLEGREDHDGTTITPERIAQEGRELLGGDEPLEAYTREVGRWVEDAREVAV